MEIERTTAQGEALASRRALLKGARFLREAGIESAQTDTEVLLRHVMRADRAELYSHWDAPLSPDRERQFQELLSRRARREPVAYITGHREFWSFDFMVTRDVLIPRPETERLVEIALEYGNPGAQQPSFRILELGTGSGAVAVCLGKERPGAEIVAIDISSRALEVARLNSERHGVVKQIRFLRGNLFEPLAEAKFGSPTSFLPRAARGRMKERVSPVEKFGLIVSNPPYVRTSDLSTLAPDIRDWEPRAALDGGADGLDFYRPIIAQAHPYLEAGGRLALEIGAGMGRSVAELFAAAGCYRSVSVYRDYAGQERVIAATKLGR